MSSIYEKKILNSLVDKYEASKSFIGSNQVNQRFKVCISKLFTEYTDHSKFEVFRDVNEAIDVLKRKGFIAAKMDSRKVYENVFLSLDDLSEIYKYLKRKPKNDIHNRLKSLLEEHMYDNEILSEYCKEQLDRIANNRSVKYFNNDFQELESILLAVKEVMLVETEQFIREFSIRIFKDSKVFHTIQTKVENLFYEYGDFPEKDQILASFNLVKTPTYVNYKGAGKIILSGQTIDLLKLSSDIAISSMMLRDIERIEVLGSKVITIENLTSFHRFNEQDFFVIYLGGFHNTVRREFIKKLYSQNPQKQYYHFGDIDVGGFRILEHLKSKTKVPFKPYHMDTDTLVQFKKFSKKLTQNDRINLERLLIHDQYKSVINFMLENNCKLEQEAVN
jgi:hypothetical protein